MLGHHTRVDKPGPFWQIRGPPYGGVVLVGYSSGQRGQTVNLLAYAYEGSNPSPTTTFFREGKVVYDQINQWF